MGKQDGYAEMLQISPDGGKTFFECLGFDSLSGSLEPTLYEGMVLEDLGKGSPEATGHTQSTSASGVVITNDPSQELLYKVARSRRKLAHFRHFHNRNDLRHFQQYPAIVTANQEGSSEDKKVWTVELNVNARRMLFHGNG